MRSLSGNANDQLPALAGLDRCSVVGFTIYRYYVSALSRHTPENHAARAQFSSQHAGEDVTMPNDRLRTPAAPLNEFLGVFLGLRTPRAFFVAAIGRLRRHEPPSAPAESDSGEVSLPSLRSPTNDEAHGRCL